MCLAGRLLGGVIRPCLRVDIVNMQRAAEIERKCGWQQDGHGFLLCTSAMSQSDVRVGKQKMASHPGAGRRVTDIVNDEASGEHVKSAACL
jgi:hypothetical protein